MSEETEALAEAIRLDREAVVESILSELQIGEVSEEMFNNLVEILKARDVNYFKFEEALRSQRVVDEVINGENEV